MNLMDKKIYKWTQKKGCRGVEGLKFEDIDVEKF